ncbi:hypothetical protein MNB_SV-14-136 [hydrothermal vent metagenome]|uniref:Outer membrane protein n=1 Tax=hydrothermal vent metagenome TaxID=652676 RepID=A0A1W1CN80_9ZZZZ
MRKIYLIALGVIVATELVQAKNFKLLIEGEGGDESGTNLNYPFYIDKKSNNWKVEVGFNSNKYDDVEPLGSKKFDGKKTTQMDEKNIYLSLSYVLGQGTTLFSIGAEYELFTQEKKQFGYYQEKTDYHPYDNNIDIKGSKLNIVADFHYATKNDPIMIDLKTTITPKTNLEIEQETKIFPNLHNGGILKSDSTMDLSYLIEGEIIFNMGKYFNFGIEGKYGFMPYDYQLKIINSTRDGYVESNQKYDEKRSEIFGKIFIKKWLSDDIFPTIGFGQRKIDIDDESVTQNLVLFGIEKWF